MSLNGKTVLITGAALRIGRSLALAVAQAGGDVVVHYGKSRKEAESLQAEIEACGRKAYILQADLAKPCPGGRANFQSPGVCTLVRLVNNASVFEPIGWEDTSLEQWNLAMMVNLTTPFLLSRAFARSQEPEGLGRIVNLIDWRGLRPGSDHLPYTISNAPWLP